MKFHFGSHHHHGAGAGGVVVPTDHHPSALRPGGGVVDGATAGHQHQDPRCPAEDELYGSAAYAQRHGNEDEVREEAVVGDSPLAGAPMKMTGMAFFHASSVASRHFGSPRSPGSSRSPGSHDRGGGDGPGSGNGGIQGRRSGNPASPTSPSPGGEDRPPKTGGGAEGSPAKEGSPTPKRALHLDHHDIDCPVSNPDPHSRPRPRQFFRLGRHRSKGIDGHHPGHPKDIDTLAALTDRTEPCCGVLSSDSSDDELGGSERTMRARNKAAARRSRGSVGRRTGDSSDDSCDELGGSERSMRARRPRRGIGGLRKPRLRRPSFSLLPPPVAPKAASTEAGTALVDAEGEATAAHSPGVDSMALAAAEAALVHAVESVGSFDPMDYCSPEKRGPVDNDAAKAAAPAPYSQKPSRFLPELTVQTHRSVTFASVQIREYATILGDHPCCPSGPPLALGWDLERESSAELDAYERERGPLRAKNKDQMRLGGDERRGILRSLVVATSASVPASPGSDTGKGDGAEDDVRHHQHNGAEKHVAALYSARELCRAERRLTRDRAALNSRAHQRRVHRGFFRPLTPAEEREGGIVVASAAVVEEKKEEDVAPEDDKEGAETSPCGVRATEEKAAASMDLSPVKPRPSEENSDAAARASEREREKSILKPSH